MSRQVYDESGRRRWQMLPDGRRVDEEIFDASSHQWVPVVRLTWYQRIPLWLELTMVAAGGGGALLLRDWVAEWM